MPRMLLGVDPGRTGAAIIALLPDTALHRDWCHCNQCRYLCRAIPKGGGVTPSAVAAAADRAVERAIEGSAGRYVECSAAQTSSVAAAVLATLSSPLRTVSPVPSPLLPAQQKLV